MRCKHNSIVVGEIKGTAVYWCRRCGGIGKQKSFSQSGIRWRLPETMRPNFPRIAWMVREKVKRAELIKDLMVVLERVKKEEEESQDRLVNQLEADFWTLFCY